MHPKHSVESNPADEGTPVPLEEVDEGYAPMPYTPDHDASETAAMPGPPPMSEEQQMIQMQQVTIQSLQNRIFQLEMEIVDAGSRVIAAQQGGHPHA